ncbi:hypothetical protein BH23VER1_BH23VER1_01490 [soil metagenome]
MTREEADQIAQEARFDVALEEGLRELSNRPPGGVSRLRWRAVAAAAAVVVGSALGVVYMRSDPSGEAGPGAVTEAKGPAPRYVEPTTAAERAAARADLSEAQDRDAEAERLAVAALDYFVLTEFKTAGGTWRQIMGQLAAAFGDSAKRRPLENEPEIRLLAPQVDGQEDTTRLPPADLRDVTIWDALQYLAARSGYEVAVAGGDITVAPMADPDVMIEKELAVPAGFGDRPLAALGSEARPLQLQAEADAARDPSAGQVKPLATERGADGRDRMGRLRDWGLTFPAGSSLDWDRDRGRLVDMNTVVDRLWEKSPDTRWNDVVTNTRRNVALLEALAGLENRETQLFITTKLITAPDAMLGAQDAVLGNDTFAQILRALSESPEVSLVTAPSIVTRSRNTATIEVVREVDFGEEGIPTTDGTPSPTGAQWSGFRLRANPALDGDLVSLEGGVVVRDVVNFEPIESFEALFAEMRSTFGQPDPVAEHGVDYDVWLADGETAMLKVFGSNDGKALWIFITARRIGPAGQPIR